MVHPHIIRQRQQQVGEGRAEKKPNTSISPPHEGTTAVGGGGKHSTSSPEINKRHEPHTHVRPLPVSSLPPHCPLPLAPTNKTFLMNPSHSDSSASDELPPTPTTSRCHPKQFPCVSFQNDHAHVSWRGGTTARGNGATLGNEAAVTSSSSLPPQRGVALPPSTHDCGRLNFEQTVQLVASCTAAATAAALTSQKVSNISFFCTYVTAFKFTMPL